MKSAYCLHNKMWPVSKFLLVNVCLLFVMNIATAQQYPGCKRNHPGRLDRLESLAKQGDTRMILSCAGHVVMYAIERYGLQANDSLIKLAQEQIYKYIISAFTSPTEAGLFFADNGYQGFDSKKINAAFILLGLLGYKGNDVGTDVIFIAPVYWQRYIEQKGYRDASSILGYLKVIGFPNIGGISQLGEKISMELTKPLTERESISEEDLYSRYELTKDSMISDAIEAKRIYGNTNTPAPDKRAAIDTGPTRESDTTVDTVPSANKCQSLLKECQARNRELEEKIRQLESKGGANNEVPSSTPIEGGYESIYLKVTADEVEVQVKVNGRLVGTYNKGATVYLDPFLKGNAMNIVSFIFSAVPKYFDNVDLDGKFPGNEKWFDVYNFAPKQGKLESKFELPFAGKKN